MVYPRSSAGLITRTLDTGGAVVSISPWGMGPRKFAFPRRNRVIAALSQALFVSEAGMPSWTFSTAEAAMDLGRELLAVPGSILSPESRGTNYLIANGAFCIVDEESIEMAISRIYGTLRYSRPDAPGIADLDPTQQTVMHALIASPLKVVDIAALVSLDAVGVLKLLGSLELEGLIERMMDGRYAPSKFALQQTSRGIRTGRLKRIGADELCQVIGMMGRGAHLGAHLAQLYGKPAVCQLNRAFRTRQTATDNRHLIELHLQTPF